MTLPEIGELRAAAATVYQAMPPTAQIRWPLVCERTGAEVWIKHENQTPLGAFKIRGGLVYMESLRRTEPEVRGVIAATRGNHGMSAAEASLRRLGTDWIDLYQLHRPDPKTPIQGHLRALEDLIQQGKVRYIGCSNLQAWQVVEAQWTAHTIGTHALQLPARMNTV